MGLGKKEQLIMYFTFLVGSQHKVQHRSAVTVRSEEHIDKVMVLNPFEFKSPRPRSQLSADTFISGVMPKDN